MSEIENVVVPSVTYPTKDIYYPPQWWQPTTTGGTSTITFAGRDHYYYQITCPKCGHKNWCELNETVTCEGIKSQERRPGGKKTICGAVLKAVSEVVDNPIQVQV